MVSMTPVPSLFNLSLNGFTNWVNSAEPAVHMEPVLNTNSKIHLHTAARCQRGSRAQTAESLRRLSNNPGERSHGATLPPETGDPLKPVPNRRHVVIHPSLMRHCSGFCSCGEYLEGSFSPSVIVAVWKHTCLLRGGAGHIWWCQQGQIRITWHTDQRPPCEKPN